MGAEIENPFVIRLAPSNQATIILPIPPTQETQGRHILIHSSTGRMKDLNYGDTEFDGIITRGKIYVPDNRQFTNSFKPGEELLILDDLSQVHRILVTDTGISEFKYGLPTERYGSGDILDIAGVVIRAVTS